MINNLPAKFNGKVYFFCDPREETKPEYKFQHLLICLAEGFRELGISLFSNVNYWQESTQENKYLFNHQPHITPDDCSIVVLTNNWFHINYPLPDNLSHPNRPYTTVYLDGEDSDKTYIERPEFRQFDFILRNHYNNKLKYAKNFYPWAYGLSNRILQELKEVPNYYERKNQILINFRHWKKGHPVRNFSASTFIPHIKNMLQVDNSIEHPDDHSTDPYHELQWLQTGKRHYPSYYNRLKNSMACACFGGFFVPAWPNDPGMLMNRIGKNLLSNLRLKSNTVVQWDSWRFWESLAAGCTTFHLDFEKYGLSLPVMPENWRHYIGIDLDNVQGTINRIADEPKILEKIGVEGRQWAIENYSPVPTALRFLETIYQQPITSTTQVSTLINI